MRLDARLIYGACVPVVVALDHATKAWAREALDVGAPVSITPFFDLTLGFNSGVAFGFLDSAGGPLVLFLTIAISVVFANWFWREPRALTRLALAFVLGGALGNVLDRALHGAVTDFIDLHASGSHWPAFNLADAAISFGAVLLVVDMLRARKQEDV